MIHLPSRTRPLTSRPAVHHPWPTFKVFFGDQADEFGHFPEALPSQNTDDVGQSPEASPSPDEISHSPEASPFQKTDGVHQSPEGSPSQKASPSPKEESGIRGEGGFNTKKSGGDLADVSLPLPTPV
ncbi:hypothetical protein B9Z19DRAFT_1092122 [Tuber borchii]|uniref:Uncharacterized protein n=1 Tax=Tuber borchii TaxID=42251 RepID=A0A2T6ZGV4_TUBBO|nr:hypothetical protein B9Z19DRAFT_1092122 [Tuber borchii]